MIEMNIKLKEYVEYTVKYLVLNIQTYLTRFKCLGAYTRLVCLYILTRLINIMKNTRISYSVSLYAYSSFEKDT